MQINGGWVKPIFGFSRHKFLLVLASLIISTIFSERYLYGLFMPSSTYIYGFPLEYLKLTGFFLWPRFEGMIYFNFLFNFIFWYFIVSLSIIIWQIFKESFNQIFRLTRNKSLLTLLFLCASTIIAERIKTSCSLDTDCTIYLSWNGFPLKYLRLSSDHIEEINYINLILNFVFWYFIAGLLFLKYPVLAIKDVVIKSWYFVKASIPSFILFSVIVIYNAPQCSRSFMAESFYNEQACISGYAVGGLMLLLLVIINLIVVHFLRSEKRKALGALLSIIFGLIIYFLLTLFGFSEASTYFYLAYYFPPTLLLIAGFYYFWKKV